MGFQRPSGKYAEQMLEPGGWPDTDEQSLLARASELTSTLQRLARSTESWLHEQAEISSGSIWAGSGANGIGAVQNSIVGMHSRQTELVHAITWLQNAFAVVLNAKVSIFERVLTAETAIAQLEAASLKPETRDQRIRELVEKARAANIAEVADAANAVDLSNWKLTNEQQRHALDNLLRTPVSGQPQPPSSGTATPGRPAGISNIRNGTAGAKENLPEPIQPSTQTQSGTVAPPPPAETHVPESPAPTTPTTQDQAGSTAIRHQLRHTDHKSSGTLSTTCPRRTDRRPTLHLGNPSTPASTNQGAAAPVPISAARAERNAIAAAAGATRRKGPNPATSPPPNVDITDPSLFWITAATSDGQILTANNYGGLAYIPRHVHLRERIRIVTVDVQTFNLAVYDEHRIGRLQPRVRYSCEEVH